MARCSLPHKHGIGLGHEQAIIGLGTSPTSWVVGTATRTLIARCVLLSPEMAHGREPFRGSDAISPLDGRHLPLDPIGRIAASYFPCLTVVRSGSLNSPLLWDGSPSHVFLRELVYWYIGLILTSHFRGPVVKPWQKKLYLLSFAGPAMQKLERFEE